MRKIIIVIIILFLLFSLGLILLVVPYYKKNYSSNIIQEAHICIPTQADYHQVKKLIAPYLKDSKSFDKVAYSEKYPERIKAGRYKLNLGENNRDLIRRLLLGKQDEVHLRIKSYNDIYELASDLGKNLEDDSLKFINYFKKQASLKGYKDVEELKIYFTPETYYMDWNTSPEKLFSRFERIHNRFWNEKRRAEADQLGLSVLEVYTLASIIQREYVNKDELTTIASLYLNRLKKDMKLQSDPTVQYAERKIYGFKVQVKRVKNVSIDSPYNTYKNKGLPPLPICIPNDFVVDAVLNPAKTDYLYMCAIKNTGRHAFTSNPVEHMKNARAYINWLNSHKIK
ncbi:MAG: endolytic transglycosylase MltG [Apibacter sp.]|nr:endolytic transglycosylase MltG [Apibacter sp.]